jgi:hypothetical protein
MPSLPTVFVAEVRNEVFFFAGFFVYLQSASRFGR